MASKIYEDFDEFYKAIWDDLVKNFIVPSEYDDMRKFMEEEKENARRDFNAGRNTHADVLSKAYAYSLMF